MQALIKPLAGLVVALQAYAATITPQANIEAMIALYGSDLSSSTQAHISQVIACESAYNPNAVGKLGELGLVQIYLKYHPSVSREEALDPEFAVKFIIQAFRDGHENWWSCHKLLNK